MSDKEKEIDPSIWTNSEITTTIDETHTALKSILEVLKIFREDHYEKNDNPNQLDSELETIELSVKSIGEMI